MKRVEEMCKKTLGNLLEETREKRKIKKVQLCHGLCTITALTRYEQDIRIPDKFLVDALLERLGLSTFRYEFVTSEQEFVYSMRRKQIQEYILNENFEKALEAINDYMFQIKNTDKLHKQYLFLKKAEIAGRYEEYKLGLEYLIEGMQCTECYIEDETDIKNMLFSNIEMNIHYLYAKYLYYDKKQDLSFCRFQLLKKYIDRKQWDAIKREEYYPHILYRLSQQEMKNYNYGKALVYLESAQKILLSSYKIDNLCEVLQLKKELLNRIDKC